MADNDMAASGILQHCRGYFSGIGPAGCNRDILPTESNRAAGNQLRKKERQIRSLERQVKNELQLITSYQKGRNKYQVEIHKKFSIPFACILFVLLGAPLGVMAKRGGFAISTSLSFGFFLLYYILLIGGEEMADRNQVPAWIGMWVPNAVVLIVSLYLILHTVRERAPISLLSFIKNREKSNP